jgi:hypothetical protein
VRQAKQKAATVAAQRCRHCGTALSRHNKSGVCRFCEQYGPPPARRSREEIDGQGKLF